MNAVQPTARSAATSRGFTLIELLVVIAIIALLVSMLIPSLKQAKELARQAVCKTNLRSLGMSSLLYESDYEAFPRGGRNNTVTMGEYYVSRSVTDYAEEDMWSLFRDYLGADLGDIRDVSGMHLCKKLRYDPPMICPSHRIDNSDYQYNSYIAWTVSANDLKVHQSNLLRAVESAGTQLRPRNSAVLWADRTTSYNDPHQKSGANHRGKEFPDGGNVAYLDGSVHWHPWVEYYGGMRDDFDTFFTMWGGTALSAPSNVLCLFLDGDGNINRDRPYVAYATWYSAVENLFPEFH